MIPEEVLRQYGARVVNLEKGETLFDQGSTADHFFKEERVLFPYVRALADAKRPARLAPAPPFGTIANPIAMMEAEHQAAGDTMAAIRELSGGYALPEDACTTCRVCYQELAAFESDLHVHVHLENNILFPKALVLEREIASVRR